MLTLVVWPSCQQAQRESVQGWLILAPNTVPEIWNPPYEDFQLKSSPKPLGNIELIIGLGKMCAISYHLSGCQSPALKFVRIIEISFFFFKCAFRVAQVRFCRAGHRGSLELTHLISSVGLWSWLMAPSPHCCIKLQGHACKCSLPSGSFLGRISEGSESSKRGKNVG